MRYMQRKIASDVGALRESDDSFWNPMANLDLADLHIM